MNYVHYEDTQENRTVRIYQDSDPMNPRTDWDGQLSIMVAFHDRYTLGDSDHGYSQSDYDSWEELAAAIAADGGIHILPLYLYDHSGISISTGKFNDRWDSGQIGFIFTTKERLEECGLSASLDVEEMLKSEVSIYDNYLRGEVYGYVVTEASTCDSCQHVEELELDSCWGFYSIDDALEHAGWKVKTAA